MKKLYLNILCIVLILASIVGIVFLYGSWDNKRQELTCEAVSIVFVDDYNFVSEEDIKGYLDQHYGAYIGQRLSEIDLSKIEKILDVRSAILKSEAYITDDGTLHIVVSQREPILRFQKGNDGFYVDERGFIFPLQKNYSAEVPVIEGNVPIFYNSGYKGEPKTEKDAKWMQDVLYMMNYMKKSRASWLNRISNIMVEENGDFVLRPIEGKEKFIFGYPDNIEEKFAKMDRYYQDIKPTKEENYYSSVNLKYDKQIVCRK